MFYQISSKNNIELYVKGKIFCCLLFVLRLIKALHLRHVEININTVYVFCSTQKKSMRPMIAINFYSLSPKPNVQDHIISFNQGI